MIAPLILLIGVIYLFLLPDSLAGFLPFLQTVTHGNALASNSCLRSEVTHIPLLQPVIPTHLTKVCCSVCYVFSPLGL